jgi:hypothetical protein
MLRRLVLVTALAALASGCGTVTGRPLSAWTGDAALLAGVKSAIVGVRVRNLTHVNVDVYDHVVYLSGTVRDVEAKTLTEEAARNVGGVRHVVSHLEVLEPPSPAASALPAAALPRPVPSVLKGIARLEGQRGYDATGRVVATIYVVPMTEFAQASSGRFTADVPVDHVTVHALEADPHVPVPHYLVVLWHTREGGPPR